MAAWEGVNSAPQASPRVHPAMLKKAGVLGGQNAELQRTAELLKENDQPLFAAMEGVKRLAVPVIEDGVGFNPADGFAEIEDRLLVGHQEGEAQPEHQQDGNAEKSQDESPSETPHAIRPNCR